MRHKTNINPFLRIFLFVAVLVVIAIAAAIGLFYYMFGITEPEGLSLASWPHIFTDNFSTWMENEDGNLKIEEIAINRLDEYGLWLQVIDETGKEIFSHNKPVDYPVDYSASELIALSTNTYENGNTVFVGNFEESDQIWNYLIGFPYAIGKHMLYYNGENVGRLSPVFRMGICFVLGFIIIFVFVYGFWITRHLGKITKGIGNLSHRSYSPLPERGMFREIYRELNKMNMEIQNSDQVQKNTERTRREWISNITHDLKTPLSPIRGYAELLVDDPVQNSETIQEYGNTILKNTDHVEKLIDDLKLTYQLEAGVLPYHPRKIRLIHYLREVVIDLVNDPAFCDREIEFESDAEEIIVCTDVDLFRRAMGNLIVNALTHNPSETKIAVIVSFNGKNEVSIIVRDNGRGMSQEEQSELFHRYYRGTNTEEKPEGSGLGLAIAKQIVILHGGDISVKSKAHEGTEFIVSLPIKP
ncbi:MAG: HAMP domain-containing histidine kinase [Lachnospiraceae bacterium]|nr:HAMP domain-containing histidine kinase [Lachnospiraceae bacterium]